MVYLLREQVVPTPAGTHIHEVFFLDVNGDTKLDLLIAAQVLPKREAPIPMQVLTGNGAGLYALGEASIAGGMPTTNTAREYVVADFNGDGKTDVFIADTGYDAPPYPGFRNTLILSTPDGYRNATSNLPQTPDYTHSATGADIDRDGDIDLYVGNTSNVRAPYFLINDGQGNFAVADRALAYNNPDAEGAFTSSVFIDANGDGAADLFLGTGGTPANQNWGGPVIHSQLLINDGAGNFAEAGWSVPQYRFWDQVVFSLATDINGDGRQDLLLSVALDNYREGGVLKVLINNGRGFDDETAARVGDVRSTGGPFIWRVLTADVNGDGFEDIILSGGMTDLNSPILINDGAGNYARMPGLLPNLSYFDKLAVGDINGDGMADFASQLPIDAATRVQGTVRTWLSQSPQTSQDGGNGNDGLMGHGTLKNALVGNAGDDTLTGGQEQDYLWAGQGNDVIFGGAAWDNTHGNQGNDTIRGGAGDDWVVGGQDNDLLHGNAGADILVGNLGADTLYGGDGDDRMHGGQGGDVLHGSTGSDLLLGDRGDDTMGGGAGADQFWTHADAGADRVLDFNGAEGDRIKVEYGAVTIAQVGQDTTLSFGTGSQMVLVGVTNFAQGWILTA